MSSVLATLRGATRASTTVPIVLDAALHAEWTGLLEELEAAGEQDSTRSMADFPETTKVVDRMEAIRDQVIASRVVFHLRAIDWADRISLQAAHPPRPGNMLDRINGYNVETYTPALIKASVFKIVGAEGDETTDIPDDVWDNLLGRPGTEPIPATDTEPEVPGQPRQPGSLNFRAFDELTIAANTINDTSPSVPLSARSLLNGRDSGASLAQPSPGTSPLDGSEDGNPPGSPTSSATKKATRSRARSTGS